MSTISHLKTYFGKNLDSWQLITKALDGGDTCSRHFTALYCIPHSAEEVFNAIDLLQVHGIPRRHPNSEKWYSKVNTTSRDQLIPYLCFVATPNKAAYQFVRNSFFELVKQHSKLLFLLTWNTKRNFRYATPEEHAAKSTPDVPFDYSNKLPDFCGPNIWAIYLRGLLQYKAIPMALRPLAYAALNVLDIYEFADALAKGFQHYVIGQKFGPTRIPGNLNHDCQNSTLVMHYCATNVPTLLSWLSWKIFKPMAYKAADSFFQQPNEPRLDIVINTLD